jgi:hypothetical protein
MVGVSIQEMVWLKPIGKRVTGREITQKKTYNILNTAKV